MNLYDIVNNHMVLNKFFLTDFQYQSVYLQVWHHSNVFPIWFDCLSHQQFDEIHTDPKIIKEVQHDPWDDSQFEVQSANRGGTQYIYVRNTDYIPPPEIPLVDDKEELLAIEECSLEEEDEKVMD